MRIELESSLERWVEAQILDRQQADRIRQLEAAQVPHRRARWPVAMALAFGGIMLAAGVLLFVSAHWDQLSPTYRMTLVVSAVGVFHVLGALSLERFRALGTTLHAVGTVALGGAIAMAGQIFNMQAHWPSAVLLWAAGAVAGWLLLRDWPQLTMAALLLPFWLGGEWVEWAGDSLVTARVVTCFVLMLALCYLSVRLPDSDSREDTVRRALTWLGGLALLPAAGVAIAASQDHYHDSVHTDVAAVGWVAAILLPIGFASLFRGRAVWMNLVAGLWVVSLNLIPHGQPDLMVYGWAATGSAGLIAWGIYELRSERVNLGMAGFAITILFFYFSSVMDKLDRATSLMVMGTLFVAGGWAWEKVRRKLVAQVAAGGAQ